VKAFQIGGNSHRNHPNHTYLPSKLTSPAKDGFALINEENGSGTEIGTFIPT
jgi:hypothetical protein